MKFTHVCIPALVVLLLAGTSCSRSDSAASSTTGGISKGQSFFSRSIYVQLPMEEGPAAYLTSALPLNRFDDQSDLLFLTPARAYVVTRATRTVARTIPLARPGPTECVDVDGDSQPEMMLGGGGYGDVGLLSAQGQVLWTQSGSGNGGATAERMAIGDLQHGVRPVFYVARRGGLSCVDADGVENWTVGKGTRYSNVATFTSPDNDQVHIVATRESASSPGSVEFEIRDSAGVLLRTARGLPPGVRPDQVLQMPFGERTFRVLARAGGVVGLYDIDGALLLKYRSPPALGRTYRAVAATARLSERDYYFVILLDVMPSGTKTSLLCVLDLNGNVVYEEHVKHATAILVMRGVGQTDVLLLIHDRGEVVQYTPRSE